MKAILAAALLAATLVSAQATLLNEETRIGAEQNGVRLIIVLSALSLLIWIARKPGSKSHTSSSAATASSTPAAAAREEASKEQEEAAARERASQQEQERRRNSSHGKLSEPQALEILGLSAGATKQEIRATYNRLMKRVHPDIGGANFFAKQLNEARETLRGAL